MRINKQIILILLVFSLAIISSNTSGYNFGFMNYTLNENKSVYYFNTSSQSEDILFSSPGYDYSKGIKIPKNATVSSANMVIESISPNFVKISSLRDMEDDCSTSGSGGYGCSGFANNGTHFISIDSSGYTDTDIRVWYINGTYSHSLKVHDDIWDSYDRNGAGIVFENNTHFWTIQNYQINNGEPTIHATLYDSDGNQIKMYNDTFISDISNSGLTYNGSHFFHGNNSKLDIWNYDWTWNDTITLGYDDANVDEIEGLTYDSLDDVFYILHDGSNRIYKTNSTSWENLGYYEGATLSPITYYDGIIYNLNGERWLVKSSNSNINLSIGSGNVFFDHEGGYDEGTNNITIDFASQINTYLSSCLEDNEGYCNLPLNITNGGYGKIRIRDLKLNYTIMGNKDVLVHYFSNEFKNQAKSIVKSYSKPGIQNTSLYLPKNATIKNILFDISPTSTSGLFLIYNKSLVLEVENSTNFLGMDFNGSHFFLNRNSNTATVSVYDETGDNTENLSVSITTNNRGLTLSPDTDTVWMTTTVGTDSVQRVFGSENPISFSVEDSVDYPYNLMYNGSHFFVYDAIDQQITKYDSSGNSLVNSTDTFAPFMAYYNFGSTYDTSKFYSLGNSIVTEWNINTLLKTGLNSGDLEDTGSHFDGGLAVSDDYFYIINQSDADEYPAKIEYYTYSNGESPENIIVKVNNTDVLTYSGVLTTTQTSLDFSNSVNEYLRGCTPNSNGYCDVPINIINGGYGNLTLLNLRLNYTLDIDHNFDAIPVWNQTSNIFMGQSYIKSMSYYENITTTKQINTSGFLIDDTALSCTVDGDTKSVGTIYDLKYCNSSNIIGSEGNWTNHTLTYSTDSGYPIIQINSTIKTNDSHKYIKFNVSGYNPDGTLEEGILFNITTKIDFDETGLDDTNPDFGLNWYNGSEWLSIDVSNRCTNGYGYLETNYSTTVINSDNWYGCYNDSNSNGIIDQLKVMMPHASLQEFEVYHEKLPFQVISVDSISPINLISNSNKTIYISFNASSQDIDMSLTTITLEKPDQSDIISYHCQSISNYTTWNYVNCSINLSYWTNSGVWTINVTARDISGTSANNHTNMVTVNDLTAMELSSNSISFGINTSGMDDVAASPLNIFNRGNQNLTTIEITGYYVNATGINNISASNFCGNDINDANNGCDQLAQATSVSISGVTIPRGQSFYDTVYTFVDVPKPLLYAIYRANTDWQLSAT